MIEMGNVKFSSGFNYFYKKKQKINLGIQLIQRYRESNLEAV